MELSELLVAEYGLIAALYKDQSMLDAISIMPADFFQEDCSLVLSAMRSGISSVPGLASKTGLGLDTIKLIIESQSGGTIEELAGLVTNEARKRSLDSALRNARDLLNSGVDVDNVVTSLELDIQVCESSKLDRGVGPAELAEAALRRAEEAAEGLYPGIPFNSKLSEYMGGLPVGVVTVLGAGTSQGKTAYSLDCMLEIAKGGYHCLYCSYEDSKTNASTRLACKIAKIDSRKIRFGTMSQEEWGKYYKALDALSKLPIMFRFDHMSSEEICYEIRRYHRQHQTKVVFIDYIQQMRTNKFPGKNDDAAISEIMLQFQKTAYLCDMSIVMLSQLRRPKDADEAKEPHRGMLRNSGSIEQAAHAIILLNRDQNAFSRNTNVILAKHKDCGLENFKMTFDGPTGRFLDVDDS